jgi:hypothetical protein
MSISVQIVRKNRASKSRLLGVQLRMTCWLSRRKKWLSKREEWLNNLA